MTGKEAFEKFAESQALGRDEWWIYWPFFKAGVDYERKREKLNAPIVLTGNRPSARGGEDAPRSSLTDDRLATLCMRMEELRDGSVSPEVILIANDAYIAIAELFKRRQHDAALQQRDSQQTEVPK